MNNSDNVIDNVSLILVSSMLNKKLNIGSVFNVMYEYQPEKTVHYFSVQFVPRTHVEIDLDELNNFSEMKTVIANLAEKVLLTMKGE